MKSTYHWRCFPNDDNKLKFSSGRLCAGNGPRSYRFNNTFTPRMSDQTWAILIGFLTVAGLRVLDWYLPKNWHSRWASRHGEKDEQNND